MPEKTLVGIDPADRRNVTIVVHLDEDRAVWTVHAASGTGLDELRTPDPTWSAGLLRAAAMDVADRHPGVNTSDGLAEVLEHSPTVRAAISRQADLREVVGG